VLPAYNEEGNIAPLLAALDAAAAQQAFALRAIVVDDGSTDRTAQETVEYAASRPGVELVRHPRNLGFARALKTGIAAACAGECDVVVFMESDLSHRPSDLVALLAAVDAGADVALGSRFVSGGGMDGVPAWRQVISRTGNAFGRHALGVPIRDLTTGYRAVRRRVVETIALGEDGFTIQLESVIKAYAAGFAVVEVPIVLGTRRHGVSHMNYSVALFRRYWQLLLACRRWMREAQA
jgi:dolichol-phosphate mannosyltransferase